IRYCESIPVGEEPVAGSSPLRTKPLRNPGQSLDEEISKLWDDRALNYVWYATGFLVLAVTEWIGLLFETPRRPILFTAVAVSTMAIAGVRLARFRRRVRDLRLGRDGERLVGQFLEDLRAG